jgi:transposase
MKYCGIDLHSNRFTCCILDDDGSREKITFDVSHDGIEKFKNILNNDTTVILEASTNTFKFAESIRGLVNEIVIVNTYKMKLIPMSGKKTDKVDAEKLAIYLKMCYSSGENLIKPVYIPEEPIQDLRSLFTTLSLVKRHIGAIKNRIHALLKQHLQPFTKEFIFGKKTRALVRSITINAVTDYQLNLLLDELEVKERLYESIEDKIRLEGAKYIKEIEILTSMTGISVITSLAIIADIATVERFPNAKHFTSYLRTTPEVDSSNDTVIIKGTNKNGRKLSVT